MDWREEMEKYLYRHHGYVGDIIQQGKHHEFKVPEPDTDQIRIINRKKKVV
jgi:hypothetical protein